MQKMDLRVKKNYKLLMDSLLILMKEKAFEDIKVTDICNLAMVHRTTFYSHFQDKYQLLEFAIKELQKDLSLKVLSNHNIENFQEYYIQLIELFLEHISEHKNIYLPILDNNHNSITMDILYHTFIEDVKKHLKEEEKLQIKHKIPIDMIAEFYSNAVFGICVWWFKNKEPIPKEKFIQYIQDLISTNTHL